MMKKQKCNDETDLINFFHIIAFLNSNIESLN